MGVGTGGPGVRVGSGGSVGVGCLVSVLVPEGSTGRRRGVLVGMVVGEAVGTEVAVVTNVSVTLGAGAGVGMTGEQAHNSAKAARTEIRGGRVWFISFRQRRTWFG
jgi:hypothetical protein